MITDKTTDPSNGLSPLSELTDDELLRFFGMNFVGDIGSELILKMVENISFFTTI